MNPAELPENILKRMRPEDRKSMNVMTLEEANERQIVRSEKELQSCVVNLLRLRGWLYINPNMSKRSPLREGWSDFTCFSPSGKTVFFECKVGKEKLRPAQEEFANKVKSMGFPHFVIRTVQEAKQVLDSI